MKDLLKKPKKALREGGVKLLVIRIIAFFVLKLKLGLAFILSPYLKERLKRFHSDDTDSVIDFIMHSLFGLMRPMQVKSELHNLCEVLKRLKPSTVLEIGTANGGTLFCFTKLAPDAAEIISIDLPRGAFGGGYPKWKESIYESFKESGQKFSLLREDSHKQKTLEKLKDILGGRMVDFLFIDGDHTYEGVKKDFELYSSLVRKGGIIAFHDIAIHPENVGCFVNLFWDEIKKSYRYEEFIEDRNQGWGGIGVLFV
jgi:predicted O-methyltransferase YrrM